MKPEEEIEKDVYILRSQLVEKEQIERLDRLAQSARIGQSYKQWGRRLVLGFGLADAVEEWINKFSPEIGKPLNEQVPVEETKSVVAAWLRYNLLKGILLLLLSSSVTGITAFFLYKQIKKQDELIDFQRGKEALDKRFFYLQVLYDSSCERRLIYSEQLSESEGEEMYEEKILKKAGKHSDETGTVSNTPCLPSFNHRQRSEAVRLIIEEDPDVIVDLEQAHFENTRISGIDFSEGFLSNSFFQYSDLRDADFSYTTATEVNFSNADLRGANFENADVRFSNFSGATMNGVNLENADLSSSDLRRVSFGNTTDREMNLRNTNFKEADLRGAERLTCLQLGLSENWATAYRDQKLACGGKIPVPPE